jgi:hypothetical protein
MRRSIACLASVLGLLVPATAFAANYSEVSNGDLSGDRLAPTAFTLDPGPNLISATSVSGDVEYFTVTVPAGRTLSVIRLTDYVGLDGTSFIGVQAGATFTVPASPPPNPNTLLGYTHFGPSTLAPVGDNVLDNIGTGAGAQGFVPPLGPGQYTFWAQQTGSNAASYTFAFTLSPSPGVPVPPAFAALLALGLGGVGLFGVRRAARAR